MSISISPLLFSSRSTLYRTLWWCVISGAVALGVFSQAALPQTIPPQTGRGAGTTSRTSKGPRALGLIELAPNGKARLIPIAILVDGKYYDAGAYKAAPVPMALSSETVYEGVLTGVAQGLFTVTGAQQSKDEDGTTGWLADGTWQTESSIQAKAAKKPAWSTPRGINEDEGPPVLRRAGTEKRESPQPTTPAPSQTKPAPTGSAGATPTATGAPAASSPSTSAPSATTAQPTTSQPTSAQGGTTPEDQDRPVLKRGEAGVVSEQEAQTTAMADAAKSGAHGSTAVAPMSASPSGAQAANQIQLIPAISDAHGPDPLPYSYHMTAQEEQQFQHKMLAMAVDEIRQRAGQLGLTSAPGGQAIRSPSQRGKAATAKPVQPMFEDVQLRVFDLADINEPELILTAKAHMPHRSPAKESEKPEVEYMITLVVREDVNGELHKSLANITDTQHLDVIPRLDLIDAVDVDGDGRAELLFREVSDTSSAFVVYRVIGDSLYPLFQGSLGQ